MMQVRRPLLRLVWLAGLPLFLAAAFLLVNPAPADAATITVNSPGEDVALNGACTLAEAILNANGNAQSSQDCAAGQGGGVVDSIAFNIPAAQCPSNVCQIITSFVYTITDPVTIDGYTQPGASPNTLAVGSNAALRIRLLPTAVGGVDTALRVQANDVKIRGLVIGAYRVGIGVDSGALARIVGCFIGTDPSGAFAVGNTNFGIAVVAPAAATIIGGASPADRNVISGSPTGISVGLNTSGVTIRGNAIGTNAAGTAGLPNTTGVTLGGSANLVGGTGPGEGNVIAYNSGEGVRVFGGTGNAILGNVLVSNVGLGINIPAGPFGVDQVTPNDLGDADTGPNNVQNFPVLTSVGVRVNTTVHGTLNSTPNRQFRVEVFSNSACDPSNHGEGETFLGALTTTTDGSGNASFFGTFLLVPVGRFITATATDLTTGDTSEFSLCRGAQQTGFSVITHRSPTTEANEGGASDAEYGLLLSTAPSANVTVPVSISDPTEGSLVTNSTLTFTPTGVPEQTVLVLGVDDGIDDGDVPYTVVLGAATSADPNYNGLNPADVSVTNVDNDDQALQCGPRPKVNVSVARIGGGQLRATVSVTTNPGTQNELRSIAWTRFDTATVVVDGIGSVQQGQTTTFATPLTQSASFTLARTPGAQSGTVRLTVTDGCGAWPTFVGGGPKAW
jgi:hypothetical protein